MTARSSRGRYIRDNETEIYQLMLERLRYESMPSRSRSWIRRVIEWFK